MEGKHRVLRYDGDREPKFVWFVVVAVVVVVVVVLNQNCTFNQELQLTGTCL